MCSLQYELLNKFRIISVELVNWDWGWNGGSLFWGSLNTEAKKYKVSADQ